MSEQRLNRIYNRTHRRNHMFTMLDNCREKYAAAEMADEMYTHMVMKNEIINWLVADFRHELDDWPVPCFMCGELSPTSELYTDQAGDKWDMCRGCGEKRETSAT